MAEERVEPKPIDLGEYKFGFTMMFNPFSHREGIEWSVIRELSAAKKMNQNGCSNSVWNLLKPSKKDAHANLGSRSIRDWLWWFDLLSKPSDKPARSWDEVPEKIKETFERIGIPEAERAYLAGLLAQYESKWFTTIWKKSLKSWGLSLPIRILP